MFCPNCGKQILEGHKFCGNCGWGVGTDVVAKSNEAVKQVVTAVASGATKAKESASKALKSEQAKKIKNWFAVKENVQYFVASILMLVPIILALWGPVSEYQEIREKKHVDMGGLIGDGLNFAGNLLFGRQTEEYTAVARAPFAWTGFAAVMAIAIYSIVLYRNKNTLKQFDKDNIDRKIMVLHVLNLIFLVTVCSLFTVDSSIFGLNPIYFMIAAIVLSLVSMKSLSGYCWIVVVVTSLANLDVFNRWRGYSVAYTLCAYASIVVQLLILNVFDFDIEQLKRDFMPAMTSIKSDVQNSIDTTKSGVNNAINAGKTVATIATGVPINAIGTNTTAKVDAKGQE